MTAAAPSSSAPSIRPIAGAFVVRPAHVATLLRQIAARSHGAVVAVQVTGAWSGGDDLSVDGQLWRVAHAQSELAVREALVAHEERTPDARLLILTPLDTLSLSWDVRARIARQRVFTLHAWELLGDSFRARAVDPRVARLTWLADVLLEQAPPSGYAPAASGILDLDTAWAHALAALLGISGASPDGLTLLRWSTRDGATVRWASLSDDVRAGVAERFTETAGPVGALVASTLASGNGGRLLAMGLVCDVLWPDPTRDSGLVDAPMRETLLSARVRIEPLVGGAVIDDRLAREWAALARRTMSELPREQALEQQRVAESILDDLRAGTCVVISDVLPTAAGRRASTFARTLMDVCAARGNVGAAANAHRAFVLHADVVADPARAERATMALRLARALTAAARDLESGFAGVVRRHLDESSWVDAARTSLLGGDVDGNLSQAYSELLRRVREKRERENQTFAERLVAWSASPTAQPEMLPVERALELFVAPIAEARPVLLLLVDGLDMVVWRQLHTDLAVRGWTWWQPTSVSAAPVAIATLPSVTAASRASLFAGSAKSGSQSTEKPDFAAHAALRRSTTSGRAPILFHKGELGSGNVLAPEVRQRIADRQQRVVGAVVNAVDDWLDRSDQVLPRWSVAAVPLLESLLQEAALAGRAVAVLSDHGHVLDYETAMQRGGESARWRSVSTGPVTTGEVLVNGPRVRAVTGQESVVLAWSESLRYTGKKTGYHGGAAPQEVIAPMAMLSRDDLGVAGWRPVVDTAPAWWNDGVDSPTLVRVPPTHGEMVPVTGTSSTHPGDTPLPTWIGELLSSATYAAQRGLAGRAAPREEQILQVLGALARSGGRVPRAAVAAALGLPELRVRGVVAGVRRVLNVEGFAVLEEEEPTGTLTLNLDLLRAQFAVSG
jgi:hypothetical protein